MKRNPDGSCRKHEPNVCMCDVNEVIKFIVILFVAGVCFLTLLLRFAPWVYM